MGELQGVDRSCNRARDSTHDVRLERGRLAVKDVAWLEVVLDHPDRAREKALEVTASSGEISSARAAAWELDERTWSSPQRRS